jgi:hypothetical protein
MLVIRTLYYMSKDLRIRECFSKPKRSARKNVWKTLLYWINIADMNYPLIVILVILNHSEAEIQFRTAPTCLSQIPGVLKIEYERFLSRW